MSELFIVPEPDDTHIMFYAGWSREHASTFTYWTLVHFLMGLLAGIGLQQWCSTCEGCRFAVLASLALMWELGECLCVARVAKLKKTFGVTYRGDHWSNALVDVLAAFGGYGLSMFANEC